MNKTDPSSDPTSVGGPSFSDGSTAKGFTMTPNWLSALVGQDDNPITGEHVWLWLTIKTWWSPNSTAPWPALKSICARSGYGRTKVCELLNDLESVGALRRISRGRHGGGRTSNRYEMAGSDGPIASTAILLDQTSVLADLCPEQSSGLADIYSSALATTINTQFNQDPQNPELDPHNQACVVEKSDHASLRETTRQPITDKATHKAAWNLFNAICKLAPDMEAATRWMLIQRMVDGFDLSDAELAAPLQKVADQVLNKLDGIAWEVAADVESPAGYVMGVAAGISAENRGDHFEFWAEHAPA